MGSKTLVFQDGRRFGDFSLDERVTIIGKQFRSDIFRAFGPEAAVPPVPDETEILLGVFFIEGKRQLVWCQDITTAYALRTEHCVLGWFYGKPSAEFIKNHKEGGDRVLAASGTLATERIE